MSKGQVPFTPPPELRRRLESLQRLLGHRTLGQTVNHLLVEATYRKLKELGFEVSPELDMDLDDDE